jgi:hyaluronate lyase
MDKVVQHINDYAVALGLSSSRISPYEWSSSENIRGWFQGDGTVWLYNYDWGQFAQNYPATVDSMHLPGVTNSMATSPRQPPGSGTHTIKSGSDHAGGVTDGTTGAAAMIINKADYHWNNGRPTTTLSKLVAQKSWFLLDGAIVALGAGIKDTYTGDEVHTTVENREMTDGIGQSIVLNGINRTTLPTWPPYNGSHPTSPVVKGAYAHLGAVRGQPTTGIGYVFLENAQVAAGTETNDKQLKEVYTTANENIRYQASYFKMYINHGRGTNTTPASYAYVTLPGKSAAETAAYAADIDSHITVLKNTADIQAIQAGDIIAMSVFKPSGESVTVDDEIYRVDKQSLVQIKKLANGNYSIAMSYPMHANGTVSLTLPFTVTKLNADAGMSVNGSTVTISSNNIGTSYKAEVSRNP